MSRRDGGADKGERDDPFHYPIVADHIHLNCPRSTHAMQSAASLSGNDFPEEFHWRERAISPGRVWRVVRAFADQSRLISRKGEAGRDD